jgi:hypothetical protein
MGVLGRAAFAMLAGCYAPDVRDCVLPCATSADCADGQVCGADLVCAAAGVTCGPMQAVTITVAITGTGQVAIGPMMCMSMLGSASCTLSAPAGEPATATAMGMHGETFTGWTSEVCAQEPASCAFTPDGPTDLAAAFAKQ